MRKFIIGAALAATTLTAAVPAAAQFYPQPAYGQPAYDQGYRQNNWGDVRALNARIDQARQQIRWQARRGQLSQDDAYRLDQWARQLRQQVRQTAYNGIDPREGFQLNRQIQRLEQRVSYSPDRFGRGNGYGYQNQGDRWHHRDGNWHDRDDR